ncbi:Zinc finger and SCAN domain-containing protein 29 [Chelonia mydas]|uniref:Zinc finger and SCAN domain-containing protein 29 n=1 Tax=Chelonia mydas TaxID=8469 RepID=M7BH04_CHEMY|nr:Zinc finger and SCAN domain-containing protein 29 [Chelonia mydas]
MFVGRKLRSSHRNYDTFGQISRGMRERGHDQDALQCRIKVKELWSAYHKAREANGRSGAPPGTFQFYKELDAILGGNANSTPSTTMDTSEWEEEEESRSEGAGAGGETPESLEACSQELFSSQEEGSQSQQPVLGGGQTEEQVPVLSMSVNATSNLVSYPLRDSISSSDSSLSLWILRNSSTDKHDVLARFVSILLSSSGSISQRPKRNTDRAAQKPLKDGAKCGRKHRDYWDAKRCIMGRWDRTQNAPHPTLSSHNPQHQNGKRCSVGYLPIMHRSQCRCKCRKCGHDSALAGGNVDSLQRLPYSAVRRRV